MKKVEEKFRKIILAEMGFSVLYALLGLFIFLKSEIANSIVGILIGTFFLLSGIIEIYTFIDKSRISLFRTNLIIGILSCLIGIFIMLDPLTLVNILNIGLGIWILVEGINKFVLFVQLKRVKEESSKIFLASSILFIFLGIIIIINPFSSILITKTIGIFIILYNILNLSDLILLKRRYKKFLNLLK